MTRKLRSWPLPARDCLVSGKESRDVVRQLVRSTGAECAVGSREGGPGGNEAVCPALCRAPSALQPSRRGGEPEVSSALTETLQVAPAES